MRNYQVSYGSYVARRKYKPSTDCASPDSTLWSGSFISKERARDDIHPGNHVSPLPYWAYERSVDAFGYSYKRNKRYQCRTAFGYPWQFYYEYTEGISQPLHINLALKNEGGGKWTPVVSSRLTTLAKNRCIAAIQDKSIDLGQVGGELLKEAGALTKLLRQIGRALLYMRKAKWRKALKELGLQRGNEHKGLSDAYLAYHFGLKPLVTTAYNLHSGIAGALADKDLYLSARGVAEETYGPPFFTAYKASGTDRRGAQIGVTYKLDDPSYAALTSLGVVNPLATAWQLTSLSFVIDWFVSVSAYLSGLTATHGYVFVGGYQTTFIETAITYENLSLKNDANIYGTLTYSGTFPGWVTKESGMKRVVLVDFPKPGLAFRFDLDINKVVTLAALLTSMKG